jgi:hypothetical protein
MRAEFSSSSRSDFQDALIAGSDSALNLMAIVRPKRYGWWIGRIPFEEMWVRISRGMM